MAKSAETKASEVQQTMKPIKPPTGTRFNAAQKRMWKALSSQRLVWDEAELVQLVRICELDQEVREITEEIKEQGRCIFAANGVLMAHPLTKVKAQNISLINQILRMLGIYNKDTRALNTATSNAKDAARDDEEGLL